MMKNQKKIVKIIDQSAIDSHLTPKLSFHENINEPTTTRENQNIYFNHNKSTTIKNLATLSELTVDIHVVTKAYLDSLSEWT